MSRYRRMIRLVASDGCAAWPRILELGIASDAEGASVGCEYAEPFVLVQTSSMSSNMGRNGRMLRLVVSDGCATLPRILKLGIASDTEGASLGREYAEPFVLVRNVETP